MSTVAAISVGQSNIVVVTGDLDRNGIIRILDVRTSLLSDLETQNSIPAEHPEQAGDPHPATPPFIAQDNIRLTISSEVDSILGVVGAENVLYKKSSLPFADQKRIEQVLPLQLQDDIPFDIEQFVVSNVVLNKDENNQFEILSSLIPAAEVKRSLDAANKIGGEPKLLTTRASCLSFLPEVYRNELGDTYVLLSIGSSGASLVAFVDGKLRHLRDFPAEFQEGNGPLITSRMLCAIKGSIISLEQSLSMRFPTVFFIGQRTVMEQCAAEFRLPVKEIRLTELVPGLPQQNLDPGDACWAVGLIALEHAKDKETRSRLVDFRKGAFAYQPAWTSLWLALKDEILPISLALVSLIALIVSAVYRADRSLQVINDKIQEIVSTTIPGEDFAKGNEVDDIEQKIKSIEEQLRGIGSLSSLSPLDTLRELSTAIGPDIDIEVDSLTINQARLTMQGSVADNPTAGRLEDALKARKDRFCGVNITPLGQLRQSRVTIRVEVDICE